MALISGFMIDRLGAKPLHFIFTGITMLAVFPTILAPEHIPLPIVWVFASLVFFFHNMGNFGVFNAGQTYFFSAIRDEERLNLGVIFYLIRGLASGIGALVGGFIIERLQHIQNIGDPLTFRIYFGFVTLIFLYSIVRITRLENLGAYSIRNVMSIIFSPREIRTVSLLNRLERSNTVSEEKKTIRALAASGSELSIEEMLNKLKSPLFTIRKEALAAFSTLPLESAVVNALVSEVKNHPFTTAYLAADIIGKRRIQEGKPVLRKQLFSKDYFLKGKCMVALAHLDDRDTIPAIEHIISTTRNPGLIVDCASALAIFREPGSVHTLLLKLKEKTQPFMRDEIILSIAGILGFDRWFYPIYISFLENSTTGISHLFDFLKTHRFPGSIAGLLEALYETLPAADISRFSKSAAGLFSKVPVVRKGVTVSPFFQSAVNDAHLARLVRFRFLAAATITWFARKK
jgi:hypothetical protein